MKFLSPLQVNLNSKGKRHVLFTWQCLHCQECLLDECGDTLRKYSSQNDNRQKKINLFLFYASLDLFHICAGKQNQAIAP